MTENGTIKEILHIEDKGSFARVHVLVVDELGNKIEAVCFVGGSVKLTENKYGIKAHVEWKERVKKT